MIKFKPIQHDVKKLFPKIPQVLSWYPEVVAAYLFGSYANGQESPLSDVDIAYLFDPRMFNPHDYLDLDLQIDVELSQALQTDEVDCKLLNKAPLEFQYEVITEGKLIYCQDEQLRERYEQAIRQTFADSNILRTA